MHVFKIDIKLSIDGKARHYMMNILMQNLLQSTTYTVDLKFRFKYSMLIVDNITGNM